MASAFTLSNEDAISEDTTDMPALKEIIDELRESTASNPQTSNTSLRADDLRISQALVLPQLSETDISTEETSNIEGVDDVSTGQPSIISESIPDALNSVGKCMSIVFNNIAPSTLTESEEQLTDATTADQTSVQQIDNIQPSAVPKPVQATTITGISKKKQHIMISYNRSCEDTCRKIRNNLKGLKYKVWMDVYDNHDNFIDGIANAISNSYIVLMCINRKYDTSFWCRREAEGTAIQGIKFIPCFMEEPFPLVSWLQFLIGGNIWIDFSKIDKFDQSFEKLIEEITNIEQKLATYPRETPPATPINSTLCTITTNPAVTTFDTIIRDFKTWVEQNRQNLKQFNRNESAELINQLIQGLDNDTNTSDNENKRELLHQLLSSTSQNSTELINNLNTSNYFMIRGVLLIMAIWAVRIVFKKN